MIEKEIKDITKELEVTEEMISSYEQLSNDLKGEISKEMQDTMLITFKALLNDYHKPFREVIELLTLMKKEADTASKINLSVTQESLKRAEDTLKRLEDDIKAKQSTYDELDRKIKKASLTAFLERIKEFSGVFVIIVILIVGGVWYDSKVITKDIVETISSEYDSLYSAFQKRDEIQQSVEAWDEYHQYCLETYVKCPLFGLGNCEQAKQEYTDKVFIPKFGNRPGTTIEGE